MGAAADSEPTDRDRTGQQDSVETGTAMRLEAVILPELGTGPAEPIVVSHWYAAKGEQVWEGDRLVEVLVGPATFDVSSPSSGRLETIHGLEDDRVRPGAVLGLVRVTEEGDGGPGDEPGLPPRPAS